LKTEDFQRSIKIEADRSGRTTQIISFHQGFVQIDHFCSPAKQAPRCNSQRLVEQPLVALYEYLLVRFFPRSRISPEFQKHKNSRFRFFRFFYGYVALVGLDLEWKPK